MIVFVFDPLAIALVVAANMAFAQIEPKIKMSVPKGMEFNKPYSQSTEALIARHKTKLSSERMKIEKEDLIMDDLEEPRNPLQFKGPFVVEKSTRAGIHRDDIYGEDGQIKRGI